MKRECDTHRTRCLFESGDVRYEGGVISGKTLFPTEKERISCPILPWVYFAVAPPLAAPECVCGGVQWWLRKGDGSDDGEWL